MKRAVALLSAGLDSSVALALAQEQGWTVALAVTLDYGQRAAERETTQAGKISAHFGIGHRVLHLPWFRDLARAGCLIHRGGKLPYPETEQLSDLEYGKKSAKAVWVPNRNGVFLEITACLAEDIEADAVIVGFNREEAATFSDNSKAYLQALSEALKYSTSNAVTVISPTVDLDKREIVREALRLEFPLPLVWSCYEGDRKMCGSCESCKRLARALAANGVSNAVCF